MHPRSRFALLAMVALEACTEPWDDSTGAPAGLPREEESPPLYVQASVLNLRAAPSPEAAVLEKLPIATECLGVGPAQGEWRKVRCGQKEGFASASLLGETRPDVEKLKAEAEDTRLTLEQRQDSALRAALLAPEDPVRFTVLRQRFLERNLELLAGAKKPAKGQPFQVECFPDEDVETCLVGAAAERLQGVRAVSAVQKSRFVVALGNAERVDVYRGRLKYDKGAWVLRGEVQERTSFAPAPVMEKALFLASPAATPDTTSPRLGQYVLDATSRARLEKVPDAWYLLKRTGDGTTYTLLENACERRAWFLRMSPDMHGRWRVEVPRPGAPAPETYWVSAVMRQQGHTRLQLARDAGDTNGPVLELPAEGGDGVASLGEQAFAIGSRDDEREVVPCGEPMEDMEDSFEGEFSPESAMRLLYGSFDAASGTSTWAPTVDERGRFASLDGFSARHFVARPWYHAAYALGAREKVLLLTETPSNEPISHASTGIVGGAVFAKTDTGWRLERANRVIVATGSFGGTGGAQVVVRGVDEEGFLASLSTGFTSTGVTLGSMLLLSDVGPGQPLRVVAEVQDTAQSNDGSCEERDGGGREEGMRLPGCYAYDTTWALKDNASSELPDVVLTTLGTHRVEAGDSARVESFQRTRTLSYERGGYR
ncbi:hypothetical protein JY651_01180 [Pyxidicoccus parkwayensis]|uniref:SH3b domain-containing protein n=1 Tax=Pyxidicoccus parkwayensis TaxID=2813578 RepID=A0ABX7NY17_9BACT|nr:hypothetical protein [Pyxidicoccus parkwaysis]QSQ23628.1 hypothetical protein JY651_01180 [Pyxidicoccus parkwaysis]